MAKIKIDNVKLRRANDNDRSMGEISFEFGNVRVKFEFPDNHNLFSPDGDAWLSVWRDGRQIENLEDEDIREAFGNEFDDLSIRRLRDVARAVVRASKTKAGD
jgi:hypothetical protein